MNRGRWAPRKLERDLVRALAATGGRINRYLVVTRTSVSARQRDHLYVFASSRQVAACEVWSGREFEERLRANAESLLRRFVNGEAFPDAVGDLAALAAPPQTPDEQVLEYLPRLFDRPAFYTPFHAENSIEDFRGALTSTIEALNTGIHRLRDGTEIRRTPSRHEVRDARLGEALRELELDVAHLRARYDELVRRGEITSCGGGRPDPSAAHFHASFHACHELDRMRSEVLDRVRALVPTFNMRLTPW